MTDFSNIRGVLLVKHAFVDAGTCERIQRAMDRGVDDAAEVLGEEIVTEEHVRRTRCIEIDRRWLDVVEQQMESLRPDVEAAFGRVLGVREGTGLLRYPSGGFYRRHRDRGDVASWPPAARRAVAVVLFLNSGGPAGTGAFTGGALRIYPGSGRAAVTITPETGLVVAFRADLLHEVLPVRSGTRDAAVDWFQDGLPGTEP